MIKENKMPCTLVLASDGSAVRKPSKDSFWAAGGFIGRRYDPMGMPVRLDEEPLKNVEWFPSGTNNIGELTGLSMAVDAALTVVEEDENTKEVIILIDSEYALKAVTKWCVKWKRDADKSADGIPMTTAGTPVKHFDLIWSIHERLKTLKKKLKRGNLHVLKIRSHVKPDEKSLKKAFHEFCHVNDLADVPYSTWIVCKELNEACDRLVNDAVKTMMVGDKDV